MPLFQVYLRKLQEKRKSKVSRIIYKVFFRYYSGRNGVEISETTEIGEGLYIGHPYCITINSKTIIGRNCNIHKGVTLGQENRGDRQGAPIIGDDVWIGINATVVGKIVIGNDVLIAANSFVNRDVPAHSIVYGNPCVIKNCEEATRGYINRRVV